MRMPFFSTTICADPSTWPAGMKTDADTIEFDGFAEFRNLCFAGEIRAVAQAHDVERLLRRHDLAMAGSCMVRVAVGYQCPVDRAHGIDIEITGGRIEPGWCGAQESFGAFQHGCTVPPSPNVGGREAAGWGDERPEMSRLNQMPSSVYSSCDLTKIGCIWLRAILTKNILAH